MKTTPNPSATKNKSGEFCVPLPPLLEPEFPVGVAEGVAMNVPLVVMGLGSLVGGDTVKDEGKPADDDMTETVQKGELWLSYKRTGFDRL